MQVGTRLNHYEISAPLGEGGMGQVYRAVDTRLKRQVAIKVLPPELAADTDGLARLEREAQVLAQLEHPNVAAVYGLEEAAFEGRTERFLVMQLAEGETLADRLVSGALPIDEAIEVARQLALGLEAAHARGIVHRDLKPANVMLSPAGNVMILDFGLAKAITPDSGGADSVELTASPTIMAATVAGVILGTAPYMAPEQARGRPVDRRADLWALGCVLFELLSGRRTFDGETATDVIASVVQREPDWDALPAATPDSIRRLLRRCLAKDPAVRLRDAGDAALMLSEWVGDDPVVAADGAAPRWQRVLPWVIAAASMVAAVGLLVMRTDGAGRPGPDRFSLVVADGLGVPTLYYNDSQSLATLTLSPDGSQIAYVSHDGSDGRLSVQRLGDFTLTHLPDTLGAIGPFFSADGRSLGFFAGTSLRTIDLPGGVPVATAGASPFAEGGSWSDDDRIVFTASYAHPLSVVSALGGEVRQLTTLDESANEVSHRWPHVLPGSRAVLFVVKTSLMESLDEGRIAVADLETGDYRVLLEGGTKPSYLESGHLVFARAGGLYAVPFDLDALEVTGSPVLVLDGVATAAATGNAFYSATRDGVLAYLPGGRVTARGEVVRVAAGEAARASTLPVSEFVPSDISPNGRRLLGTIGAANDKLWLGDLETGTLTRVTSGAGNDQPGAFSPDGRWIIYASDLEGGLRQTYRIPIDGSSRPELLVRSVMSAYPGKVSARAGLLGFTSLGEGEGFDAHVLPIDGSGAATGEPLLVAGGIGDQGDVAPSPDGTLVAYTSTESGRSAVYVVSLRSGNRVRISRGTGERSAWGDGGRRLYFMSERKVYGVDLLDPDEVTFGDVTLAAGDRAYRRFVVDALAGDLLALALDDFAARRSEIRIDLNWGSRVLERFAQTR